MYRKNWPYLSFILILFASPFFINAEEEPKEKPKVYSSSTSFSALLTAGNSRDLTISVDTDQNLKFRKDKLNIKASLIYSRSNSDEISEIYSSSLQYNRQFNARAYLLGMTSFSRNVLSGYRSRFAMSIGAGYFWILRPQIEVSSDIALGWSSENNAEKLAQQAIGSELKPIKRTVKASFFSSIVTTRINLNLSSTSNLIHQEVLFLNLEELAGYRITSYTALSASISKYFALKTSMQVMYENRPVLGYKNTDLYLLSSIVFKI